MADCVTPYASLPCQWPSVAGLVAVVPPCLCDLEVAHHLCQFFQRRSSGGTFDHASRGRPRSKPISGLFLSRQRRLVELPCRDGSRCLPPFITPFPPFVETAAESFNHDPVSREPLIGLQQETYLLSVQCVNHFDEKQNPARIEHGPV